MRDENFFRIPVAFRWKLDVRFAVLTVLLSSVFVIFSACSIRKESLNVYQNPGQNPGTETETDRFGLENVPMPAWVPDGYQLSNLRIVGRNVMAVYKSAEGTELVYRYLNFTTLYYSDAYNEAELPVLEDVTVHGEQGVLCSYGNCNVVIWVQDNHIYMLESEAEPEEVLLKMADLFS